MTKKNSDFKIKFDGEQHSIDANLLVSNLMHTTTVIQELNRNLDSGKKIDIKIKALDKGSFLIHIDLVETAVSSLSNLLTKDNIEFSGVIIANLVGLIELKKFLKGKKEKSKTKEGDKVRIENQNGDTIIIENFVQNIYENNTIIRDSLSQSFEAIDKDGSITGFEITDREEKPLVRVDRNEFDFMSMNSEEIVEGEKTIIKAAVLNIVRISFDKKLKWEFYLKGNKITAKVNDPDFQKRIDKGESFAKGDVLEVELEIKQKFDPAVNTYINRSYKINRIINHISRSEQSKLDFD